MISGFNRLRNSGFALGALLLLFSTVHLAIKLGALGEWSAPSTSIRGKACPSFERRSIQDSPSSLRFDPNPSGVDFQIVVFWASWCIPCQIELTELDGAQPEFERANARITTVSIDESDADARRFLTERQLTLPAAWDRDGAIAELFHVRVIPVTFIVKDGIVVERLEGMTTISAGTVRRLLLTSARDVRIGK